MPFITRPNFEDRQVVQYSGDTITLSGGTNINNLGSLQINAPILDFTGTTTASTIYNIAGVQGYVNYGQPSSFIIQPPIILQSGTTGTTTVDVTGYILGGMDSSGRVTWYPASYFLTGGTAGSGTTYVIIDFTGNTSASCITDLFVTNINGCSPLHIQPINGNGDVYIGENGGVNVGIGTNLPIFSLHVEKNQNSYTNGFISNSDTGTTSTANWVAASDFAIAYLGAASSGHAIFPYMGVVGSVDYDFGIIGGQLTPANIRFYSGTDEKMVITTNGDVGIGTSPSERLDVSGKTKTIELQVTNGANIGYVLTSDVFGNATWQPAPSGTGGTTTIGPYVYSTGTASIVPLSGNNTSESSAGVILGGIDNYISGTTSGAATIVNGNTNLIYRNRYGFIGGGVNNNIIRGVSFASHNTIVNGNNNIIYHPQEGGTNFIGNGLENAISGTNITHSFIGNGQRNLIRTTTTGSDSAAILNGTDNIIGYGTSPYGLILNGSSNNVGSTRYSTVVNGDGNVVGPNVGHSIVISGKDNRIFNPGSSPLTLAYDLIGDGSGNTINISTYSSITNGRGNSVDFAAGSSILNGGFNLISYSDISTTINGVYNTIDNADYSTIINGTYNVISGFTGSTIIGGNNIIADDNNTVYVPKLTAGIPTYTPNETSVFKVNERNAFGRIRPNYISDLIWSGNTTGTTFDIPIPAGWVVEDVSIYVKSNDTNVQMSTISTTGGVWGSTTYTMFIPPLIHNIFTYMNITSNGPNYFTSPDTLSVGFYDAFGIPATPTNGLFYIMIRYWDGNELF